MPTFINEPPSFFDEPHYMASHVQLVDRCCLTSLGMPRKNTHGGALIPLGGVTGFRANGRAGSAHSLRSAQTRTLPMTKITPPPLRLHFRRLLARFVCSFRRLLLPFIFSFHRLLPRFVFSFRRLLPRFLYLAFARIMEPTSEPAPRTPCGVRRHELSRRQRGSRHRALPAECAATNSLEDNPPPFAFCFGVLARFVTADS